MWTARNSRSSRAPWTRGRSALRWTRCCPPKSAWARARSADLEVKQQLVAMHVDRTEFPIEPGAVDPREICLALDEMLPPEIGVVTGGGWPAGFSNMLFN